MGGITEPFDWAADQVENLKKQINQLIKSHQQTTDQATKLTDSLKKLDLEVVAKSLQKMSENISQNLQTIIADQEAKIGMLENTNVQQIGEQERNESLAGLMKMLNLVLKVASFASLAFASNPIMMAFEGLLIAFTEIMNIFNFINNIIDIGKLGQKLDELNRYFAPGGEYEKNLTKISEAAYQLVENFFMFAVGFNGMMQELTINVNLLSISDKSKLINYKKYIDFLKKNPINSVVLLDFQNLYRNLLSIKTEHPYKRIASSGKYIDDFYVDYDLGSLVNKMKEICDQFQKDSEIGSALQQSSTALKDLTALKGRFQAKFEKRKTVEPEKLQKFDQDLFEDMLDDARKFENPQLTAVQVVSFYTIEFFADDPTGKTLLKYNLKDLFEKTESLNCLGTNSSGQNIIYLHNQSTTNSPDSNLTAVWDGIKQKLKKKYLQESKANGCQILKFYMRIQAGSFTINGEQKSKLNYYYGIHIKTQGLGQFFEKQHWECTEDSSTHSRVERPSIISHYEDEGSELAPLCKYMSFYINAVAYPERVIKFSIFKQDNKYKAVLSWNSLRVKPEYFGKIVKSSVKKISEAKQQMVETKEEIFYTETFADDNSIVAYSLI